MDGEILVTGYAVDEDPDDEMEYPDTYEIAARHTFAYRNAAWVQVTNLGGPEHFNRYSACERILLG